MFHITFHVIFLFLFCLINGKERNRVAIIGGGVGGTTAAYELSLLATEHDLNIDMDLYEEAAVGGRLATMFVHGFEFEIGGSIIHEQNKYMQLFVKKFNLSKNTKQDENKYQDIVGFYNGDEFVYVQSRYELWSMAKLWWRYGWDLIRLGRQLIHPLLSKFKRIYEIQKKKESFNDVHSLLAAMDADFPTLLKVELRELLIEKGFNERFINEIVFLATNINYNQNIDIHAFVGSVALAGAEDSLWSVQGGNKKVPEALLAHSDANFIMKRVESISLTPSSKYALQVDDHSYIYDYVIVACPLMQNSENHIKFEGFPQPINVPVKYQKIWVTLVHGVLNHLFFHYEQADSLPNQIFSVNNDLFFNSISVLNPVTYDKLYDRKVFKVFSKKMLKEYELNSLFLHYDNFTTIDWLAYPKYDTNDKNLSFVLHDNLLYVNGIEWAASAMEMSALSGMNAALQVFKRIEKG